MKPKVVLTYPFHPRAIRQELAPHCRIVMARSRHTLARELRDAQGLITCLFDPVDKSLLLRAPRLQVIANVAVGVDNIDVSACTRRGILVLNTPDVLTRATAELTLLLLLAVARRLPEASDLCQSGQFKGWLPDLLLGLELKGRRAVIVGPGRIGREVARLFKALGLRITFVRRGEPDLEIRKKLRKAQILSLHLPLNSQTHHWLNRARIGLLPKDCIVLNTTRGPTVDESALIEALQERRIFGAGLDVFEREPKIPLALRRLPHVVLTPHIGSATEHTRQAMALLAIRGVVTYLSSRALPPNRVNFVGAQKTKLQKKTQS